MGPRVDISGAEKQVVVSDATDGSLANFHNDGERTVDFQAFMMGSPISEGGQHDLDSRGLTTDTGQYNQPHNLPPSPLIPDQPQYVQSPPTPQPTQVTEGGHDFRRLYGQSENEKGELRRALQQQMDANTQLLSQMQQLLVPPTNPYPNYSPNYGQDTNSGYPPPNGGGNFSYAPPNISYSNPQPSPIPQRFVNKQQGEMVLAEDLEGTLQQYVAPAYYSLYQDTERVKAESAQMKQMLVQMEKDRRGITPQLEAAALTQQPWIRNLSHNPQAYLGALGNFAESQRTTALLQRTSHPQLAPTPPAQATIPGTSAAATRRITYVEGTNAPSQSFEPQSSTSSFEREMEAAKAEPSLAKRAAAMRTVMTKYGITEVSGYRDPSVITR